MTVPARPHWTLAEPCTDPDAPSITDPEPQEPERVQPDASGFLLSTLETKNVSLLYIDPVQTYLTPYVAKAFENAIEWHMDRWNWTPWDRTTASAELLRTSS